MRALIGLTAAAAALGLAACSSTVAEDDSAAAPAQITPSQDTKKVKARYQVQAEGAMIRQFSLPTFAEFVHDPYVSNVIVGTVEASRTAVSQPGTAVETVLTITVEDSKESTGQTVTAREYGGIVTVEQVRDDFEAKLDRKLTKKELTETVDYQWEGVPHAQIGDRVLLAVTDDASDSADYLTLTRLMSTDTATNRAASASFDWDGEPPNHAWDGTVTPADLY
ncbi:hypothetical protein [Nocardioides sp. NPDC006273]|uniref:hypothetical protein n=1 Tax=Nocardioides sp. NPDC006273 TaxID=3155598 RepID=UPI0033B756A9